MDFHLLIHNVVSMASIVATTGLFFFLLVKNSRTVASRTLSAAILCAAIFITSHVIGVNLTDPLLSERVFMFNLIIFFLGVFTFHSILAILGKDKERRGILILLYASAVVASLFFIILPDLFLLPSIPKMYFPNYYEPGVLNWVRIAFLYGICMPCALFELISSYVTEKSELAKKQIAYMTIAFFGGYATGFIPNFLVYDINVDPLWGMLFGVVFAVPFLYGSVKYELLDVRVIAKNAFFYSVAVAIVGSIITFLFYLNEAVKTYYPAFPSLTIPLVSAIFVVLTTILVWKKVKEDDILKYEFVSTVTHKFRTPLTHIKWSAENLAKQTLTPEGRQQIETIESANAKLTELTNLLVNVSDVEDQAYTYRLEKRDVSLIVKEAIESVSSQIALKRLKVQMNLTTGANVLIDATRIRFVAQTFIENAIQYSHTDTEITVSVSRQNKMIVCSVKDMGIGIPKNELPFIFSKFYRASRARSANTEGMGVGLFIAKEIVNRHKGKIWTESPGLDKGSTFSFALQAVL
ncbi:MAG: HAMP domain-containing sensor histidine kinase [Candidatus Taylorbacteria bacterium]